MRPVPALPPSGHLPATNADSIRDAVVQDLMAVAQAEAGDFYQIVNLPGEDDVRVMGHRFFGSELGRRIFKTSEGDPLLTLAEGSEAERLAQLVGALTSVNTWEVQYDHELPPFLVERFWQPVGITSSLGTAVVSGSDVVGWLGAFTVGSAPRFPRTIPKEVQARLSKYIDLLSTAHILDHAGGSHNAVLLVHHGREIEAISGTAETWLAKEGLAKGILAEIRKMLSDSESQRQMATAGALVSIMSVADQTNIDTPQHLVIIRATQPMNSSLFSNLSRTQRRIAAMAVAGASRSAIGAELGITESTVQTHMTSIYKTLGIHTRGQLALYLREQL